MPGDVPAGMYFLGCFCPIFFVLACLFFIGTLRAGARKAKARDYLAAKQDERLADQANPNLIPCPDCGQQMSPRATACPKCGRPN